MTIVLRRVVVAAVLAVVLAACGQSDSPVEPIPATVPAPAPGPVSNGEAPVVKVGDDQSVPLAAGASLNAVVTDDGLPNPPGSVSLQWSQVSGNGTSSFTNENAASTDVSFSEPGTYVLRLVANDGAFETADELSVTVLDPPVNMPPTVDTGSAKSGFPGTAISLEGIANDDGLPDPPGTISASWSVESGPGDVYFANASSPVTEASFDSPGDYVLRLTANDGEFVAHDEVIVSIAPVTMTFTDITSASGTGGPAHFGGHGVQFADVDSDGLTDFYVTMNRTSFGDMAELFYENVNGAQFTEEAASRGIDNFDTGSHGGVFADIDNDGDFDLFNGSYDQNRLFENDGSGSFTDMTTQAGLPVRSWPTRGVVAFDIEPDGDLDIVGINGYLGSGDPSGERNEIYRNNGRGTFTTDNLEPVYSARAGQGITAVDYNNDGYVDLFAANRSGSVVVLLNDNGAGFIELAGPVIGLSGKAGDGISFGDVDNDGHLDAILDDRLFLAKGDGTFTFSRSFIGPEITFMSGLADLDNDGDLDIVLPGANLVYRNDGNGAFTAGDTFVVGTINDPRAVAFADVDNDGDLDFFYAQKDTYNILVRNDYVGPNRWVSILLRRSSGQVGAFGARIFVYEAGGLGNASRLIAWREVSSQEGYLAQNDPRTLIGLGNNTTVDIRVVFPGGSTTNITEVSTNQFLEIDER